MPLPVANLATPLLAAIGTTITLHRRAAGTYVDGLWVSGGLTTSSLTAHVQPADPETIQILPEGERTEGAIAIYTRAPLISSNDETGLESDRVVWNGREYRVRIVEDWTQSFGYARALAVRLEA